jgi:hypothetical protein
MKPQVTLVKLALCGPSDVAKEIDVAKAVVEEWNLQHGEASGFWVTSLFSAIHRIWLASAAERCAQLVFRDLSTPKDKGFSVYRDMADKLERLGVPEREIAFIQDYNSDASKLALFREVRSGKVRILFGSTQKMGSGTTVRRLVRRKVLRKLPGLRRILIPKPEVLRYLDTGEMAVPLKTLSKSGPEVAQKTSPFA